MIAGCYTLDLYCENYAAKGPWPDKHGHEFKEFPTQYTHELGSKCRQAARRSGWLLKTDGRAYCPKCAGVYREAMQHGSLATLRTLLPINAVGKD